MTQLNQIVAIEKGVQVRAETAKTKAYQAIQRAPQLTGISRTYRPKDEEGDQLPSESTLVQVDAEKAFRSFTDDLTRLIDVRLTKDAANQEATGNIVVGTETIAENVPVTFLLTLEKQLVDLRTFINALPTLDPGEKWSRDENTGVWATEPTETTRTKRVLRNHVKHPGTDKHPPQVETYSEDEVVGYWRTVKFSGAVPATRVAQLVRRIDALIDATKMAREAANSRQIQDKEIGAALFAYLLAE